MLCAFEKSSFSKLFEKKSNIRKKILEILKKFGILKQL